MKKIALVLVLLLIPMGLADDVFTQKKVGDVVEDGGWNISIINIYSNSVVFAVSGLEDPEEIASFYVGSAKSVKGLKINVTEIFYDAQKDLRRVSFTTQIIWMHECLNDSQCDDGDACTRDECSGYPRVCNHANITECVDGDGCCPSTCRIWGDSDCVRSCNSDSDCDDGDASTKDECENNKCKHTEIVECVDGDGYCPNNCTYSVYGFLSYKDNDCSPESECVSHEDCDDGNTSTIDLCWAEPSTEPKKCIHTLNESASAQKISVKGIEESYDEFNYTSYEPCARLGERINEKGRHIYCSLDGWQAQKEDGQPCRANFECLSNTCENFVCKTKFRVSEPKEVRQRNVVLAVVLALGVFFYILMLHHLLKSKPRYNNL